MRFKLLKMGLLVGCMSGCASDPYLKTPTVHARSAAAELRAAEYHDPFPDDQMGPKTFSRPLGFQAPRTTTRQSAELRQLHMLGPGEALLPKSNQAERRYSQVVED